MLIMFSIQLSNFIVFTVLLSIFGDVSALACHQCNGWSGNGYKPGKTQVSTCDNRNNQCSTSQFCVKIVDPIDPEYHYVTYKSDCWFETTILTNASVPQTVTNNACYTWSDGANPPKTYMYCFCNDRNFCNSSTKIAISTFGIIFFVLFKVLFY